jgi:hypothetical protein
MHKDDCQEKFYFSFEKCDGKDAGFFGSVKMAKKIGFPPLPSGQHQDNAALALLPRSTKFIA